MNNIFGALFILAAVVAVSLVVLPLFRGTSRDDFRHPLAYLLGGLITSYTATATSIGLGILDSAALVDIEQDIILFLFIGALLVALIAGVIFGVALGTLAFRMKRSPIIWIGVSIMTAPLGPLVAFFRMRRLATNANRQSQSPQNESAA